MRGCVDAWMRGCVDAWMRGCEFGVATATPNSHPYGRLGTAREITARSAERDGLAARTGRGQPVARVHPAGEQGGGRPGVHGLSGARQTLAHRLGRCLARGGGGG